MTVREMRNVKSTTLEEERITSVSTTTVAPARVRSTVPSRRVLRTINQQYTIPVGYTREGDTLTLFSSKSWWKNLRGGRIALRLQGRERTGRAEVIEDRAAVLEAAKRLVAEYGFKDAGRRIGLALDIRPPPSRSELALAMEGRVVIRLILDP